MKCTIPEISWHNRDPVLSVDIHCTHTTYYKLASGGTDSHVLIWRLKVRQNGAVDVSMLSDLNRHQKSVNVVRWSPTGTYLATGDDDANIIIWNLKTDNIPLLDEETNDEETWVVTKVLRGHKEDVYDISWSPNEMKLVSGSIDNTAILWDFNKGQTEHILSDHKGFVQGVTWDPKGDYIATICSDRICRIFDSSGRHVRARIYKGLLPVPESDEFYSQEIKYFHDDTFKSYFRRLSYSPDGNLLIVPSGCAETANGKPPRNATYVFAVGDTSQPVAVIQSPTQITIAVRCCPILFELRDDGCVPLVDLPYRMIIAVATDSDVVLYDTQQVAPFAHLRKIHYTRITDLAWSSDGLLLVASSTDGFCTLITFQKDELGVQYTKEESEPEDVMNVSGCDEMASLETETKIKEKNETEVKKPTILEKWTIRTPKADDGLSASSSGTPNLAIHDKEPDKPADIRKATSKRIAPIRLGDCSQKKPVTDVPTPVEAKDDDGKKKDEQSNSELIIIEDSCDATSKVSPLKPTDGKDTSVKVNAENHKHITPKKNSILNFFQLATGDKSSKRNSTETGSHVIDLCKSDEDASENPSHLANDDSASQRTETQTEKENVHLVSIDNGTVKQSTEAKVNTLKMPRRIPFVTLGSPKRKKKE